MIDDASDIEHENFWDKVGLRKSCSIVSSNVSEDVWRIISYITEDVYKVIINEVKNKTRRQIIIRGIMRIL
jgi:hypothetical protein